MKKEVSELLILPLRKLKINSIIGLVIMGISGCATFPEQKKITQFGLAATSVTSAISQAYNTHVKLAGVLDREDAAGLYIFGDAEFSFPPVNQTGIVPHKIWQLRLSTVNALQSYAQELANISAPGNANKTAAAGATLVTNIIGLAQAVSGQSFAEAKAVPGLTDTAINIAVNQIFARRVHETILKTDPYIQQVVELLTRDLSYLQVLPVVDLDTLGNIRRNILRRVQTDNKISAAQRYDRYQQMLQIHQDDVVSVAIYDRTHSLLVKFAKAHSKLLKSKDDERSFDDFISTASGLASSLQTLQGG